MSFQRSSELRGGSPRWRRLTEERSPRAKSVFHFDVQGSVAKSAVLVGQGDEWQTSSRYGRVESIARIDKEEVVPPISIGAKAA